MHCIHLANQILSSCAHIGIDERNFAFVLLDAVIKKIDRPHDTWLSKNQGGVVYDSPHLLLLAANKFGVCLTNDGFVNPAGSKNDAAVLFRRVVMRIASKISAHEARSECWKTRHVGLAYLEQPLSYLDEAVLFWRTADHARMVMRGGVKGVMRGVVVFDESKLRKWGLMKKMERKMRG